MMNVTGSESVRIMAFGGMTIKPHISVLVFKYNANSAHTQINFSKKGGRGVN